MAGQFPRQRRAHNAEFGPTQKIDPIDDLMRIVGEREPEPPRQDLSFPRRRGGQSSQTDSLSQIGAL